MLDPGAERLGMGDVAVTVLSITEGVGWGRGVQPETKHVLQF